MSVLDRDLGERPTPILRLVFLALVVLAVHGLVFQRLRVVGIGPNLFVLLAVVGGLELGVSGGAAMGILAGIAADMCTSLPVGVWALVCGLIGLTMGLIRERAFTGTLKRPPLLFAFGMTLVAVLAYPALALVVAGVPLPSPRRFGTQMLIEPFWAAILAVPMRAFVRLIMGGSS